MSKFTTRVELYGTPSAETYEKLHAAMEKGGFTRKIKIDETTYWLPHAEYSWDGTETAEQIKNKTVTIVTPIWKDHAVLVTKTNDVRAIHNLKKV